MSNTIGTLLGAIVTPQHHTLTSQVGMKLACFVLEAARSLLQYAQLTGHDDVGGRLTRRASHRDENEMRRERGKVHWQLQSSDILATDLRL